MKQTTEAKAKKLKIFDISIYRLKRYLHEMGQLAEIGRLDFVNFEKFSGGSYEEWTKLISYWNNANVNTKIVVRNILSR